MTNIKQVCNESHKYEKAIECDKTEIQYLVLKLDEYRYNV